MTLIVSVVIGVLLAMTAGLVHLPPVRRFVLEQGGEYVRTSQQLDVQAGSLSYNLFGLSATLRDVTIRAAGSPESPPLLTATRAYVDLDATALLRGRFAVDGAEFEGVRLHLTADSSGRWNLPESEEESRGPPGQIPRILIDSLTVSGAELIVEDARSNVSVRLGPWRLSIDGQPDTLAHAIRFSLQQAGETNFEGRRLPLNELALQLVWQGETLQVRNARARLGSSSFVVAGRIDSLGEPVGRLGIDSHLDLEELARFAASLEEVGGTMEVQGNLTESLASPRFRGAVRGSELAYRDYQGIGLNANPTWDPASKVLALNTLTVSSPYGNVEGRASLATESGESSIEVTLAEVDLDTASRAMDLGVRISSVGSGAVSARWPALEFAEASGTAEVRLQARGQPSENVLPIGARLRADAEPGRVRLQVASLEALGSTASGDVVLRNQSELGGAVRLEARDLTTVLERAFAFLGSELPEQMPRGAVRLNARLGGTIDAPTVSGELEGTELGAGEIQGASLNASAEYDGERLSLASASLLWQGQAVTASGEIGLSGESPALDLNVSVERLAIEPVVTALGQELPVSGVASLSATVNGTASEPVARVQLTGENLTAYGEQWGRLSAEAAYQNGRVELSQLRLDKPGSEPLTASGWYEPESERYGLAAESGSLDLAGLELGEGNTVAGRLRFSANGEGTVANPSGEVDASFAGLVVGERSLGDIDLSAQVADQVADVRLRAPRVGVDGNARVGIETPFPADFEISARLEELARLEVPGPDGEAIGGSIRGTVSGSGELADWRTLDAWARFDELRLVVNQQDIRAAGRIEARIQNGVVRFEPAEILAGDASVRLDGALPIEAAASSPGEEFRLEVAGALQSLLAFVPAGLAETDVQGSVKAVARLRGSLERPEPSLVVTLRDGAFSPPGLPQPVTGIELDAATRDGIFALDRLVAEWAGSRVSVEASAPLRLISDVLPAPPSAGQAMVRFRAEVQGLDVAAIEGAPEGVGGTVALEAEGESPSLNLADVIGHVQFNELQLATSEFRLRQTAPVRVSLRDSVLTVDSLDLRDRDTSISATGTARLDGDQALALEFAATTDASLLSSFTPDVRATGLMQFTLAVGGTLSEPLPTGMLQLQDGRIATDTPRLQGEDLNVWVRFTPGRVEIVEATGELNGGDLDASGYLTYDDGEVSGLDLGVRLERFFLEFPQGLRTLSNTDLKISQQNDQNLLVSGRVQVTEGSFRDPLDPANLLGSAGGVEFVQDRDPLLSRIRFRVDIETDNPIVVDNNLAELTVTSDLVLTGTYYRPGLTGRLRIDEGGKIQLAEHEYVVDTGIIDFVNENEIQPSLNVLARTRTRGYDIDLRITGSPGELETAFTSDPDLSEPDILSVLLTGRTLDEARGSELNIAREQAMSYLTGQLGGRFSRAAEEALGLSRVRIEPNLVSAESNPGARLTVGQDLRPDLRLIYSMNLVDSSDQILIGEYDLTRRFNVRGTNQSDNSRRLDIQHDLSFGGSRRESVRRTETSRIGAIAFSGDTVFPEDQLLNRLDVKPGQRYDFFRLRRGLDRLERLYRQNEYLEATVRLGQQRNIQSVDITINIDAGPDVTFVYEGYGVPDGLRNRIRDIWAAGVFDTQRAGEAETEIRKHLIREGFIAAELSNSIETTEAGAKTVLFDVQPGTRYGDVNLVFEGADGIDADQLRAVVREEPDGFVSSILNPQPVVDLLTLYLRQQGYLAAKAGNPERVLDAESRRAEIVFPIDEGPLYRIGNVEFAGNGTVSDAELEAIVVVYPEDAYQPERLQNSVERLEEAYWRQGYNDITIRSQAETLPETARVNIRFVIDEGRQDVVEQIEVAGNDDVGDRFVRNLVQLSEGDILDYRRAERSRRALYKTGAFSLVELETEPLALSTDGGDRFRRPLLLRARVREVVPYTLRYGGFYDTDRGPGFIFDFENRNSLLGGARLLGVRGRYDADIHEMRGYFGQPFSFRFPSIASATTFARREFRETFITDRIGFSLLHELELKQSLILSYGYRFERAYTYEIDPDPFLPFDETLNIAPLTTSLSWDTRDELLDATRGFFTSHGVEYAPSYLGSDLRYIKYLGQYFKYFPLTEPDEIPFGQGTKRPRVVYAVGGRVGLARGFGGQSVIPSERFFAGGGTTVRGFVQNSLGPTDYFGDPSGGEALFVTNNELRFPLFSLFEGVGFLDIGNVYRRAADFNPFDVRGVAGPGLRVRTPYFLLRLDYGFKLDRKPGESTGEFFFSIGQAF